jgi:hypothetical protein
VKEFTCGRRHFRPVVRAFRRGFGAVFDWDALAILSPEEIRGLIAGEPVTFTLRELEENVLVHGYEQQAREVRWFRNAVLKMPPKEQAGLLQFMTGYRQAPIGGLSAIRPAMTVVRKTPGEQKDPDEELPLAAVCSNTLKLPPYSSEEVLFKRLMTAVTGGRESFAFR